VQFVNNMCEGLIECHNLGYNAIDSNQRLFFDGHLDNPFDLIDFRQFNDLADQLLYHVRHLLDLTDDLGDSYDFLGGCWNLLEGLVVIGDLVTDDLYLVLGDQFLYDPVVGLHSSR
jgi:hypothetical protein